MPMEIVQILMVMVSDDDDDTNIDGVYIILKTICGYDDDKTIHGGGDDTNIDDDY